jgi:DegV family protein with EDD domain
LDAVARDGVNGQSSVLGPQTSRRARVAIVTDSTSDLPPELQKRFRITTVPLNVHFGAEVYRDQVDLTSDAFMDRLARARDLPLTSQPSSGLFEETFRRLAVEHDAIVAVHISEKLSGTIQSATIARDAVTDVTSVEVVDSMNATMGLGFLAIHAAELADRGLDAAEIARRLRARTGTVHVVFFVDTLEYLQRGGRIGKAASLVGSLLNLKPLLRVDEGQIVPFERTRSRHRATQGLIDFVRGFPRLERLSVLHNTTSAEAESRADHLAGSVPREVIVISRFSPVIGTHVGPGAMGVVVYEGEGG